MIKNITVVGGGSTGHAAAAIYSNKGFNVTFYDNENYKEELDKVAALGSIEVRGKVRMLSKIGKVTMDPAEAIKDAELIAIHVMASRHEEVARAIAPYVCDGQHILIVPGNLGAFVFRKVFEEMGVTAKVTLTEQEGNMCPCRVTGDAEVTVGMPLGPKRIASLPASDTAKVLEALEGVWDFKANENVFVGALNANNVVMHIGSSVLSTSKIETMGDDFILFQHGFTPTAVKVAHKLHEERLVVLNALGVAEHASPMGMYNKVTHFDEHPEVGVFRTLNGPNCVKHRYLTEDCGCGAALLLSFAKRLGIEMPVLKSFVEVAGIITDEDYIADGRTLENLGFGADMSIEEIFAAIM